MNERSKQIRPGHLGSPVSETAYTTPDEWEDELWDENHARTEAALERGRNADEATLAATRARWEQFYGAHKDDDHLDFHAIGEMWIAEERLAGLEQDPEERATVAGRVVADARKGHHEAEAMRSAASDIELEKRRSSTYGRADSEARGLRDDLGSGEVSIVLGPTGNPAGRPRLGTRTPNAPAN